jgi:UDP-glucose 4-epimerase
MTLPKTIGVTGAAGFVGANLVERLLDEGCTVVGVDDFSMSSAANLAGIEQRDGFVCHEYDCRDEARLLTDFADCEAIVHLAAMKIPRYGGALRTLAVNTEGAHVAFDVAMKTGARVILASTSDVYGNAEPPFREDGDIVLGTPTSIRWSYATSKLYDEHVALRLFEERDLQVSILRLFNAYGPRNHPSWWGGPLAVFLENLMDGQPMQLHGDGRQVRSFTFVRDTVDGFVRALATPESAGEIINVANDEPIAICDLAERVQAAMGYDGPLRAEMVPFESMGGNYQDVNVRIPSTEKAERILGFKAQVKLEEGLVDTIAWHRGLRAAQAAA